MALTLSPTTFIFGCVREREGETEREREGERREERGREGERRERERENVYFWMCERGRETLGSLSMSQVKAAWPHTSCIAPTMILMIQQQACKRGRTKWPTKCKNTSLKELFYLTSFPNFRKFLVPIASKNVSSITFFVWIYSLIIIIFYSKSLNIRVYIKTFSKNRFFKNKY